MVISRTVRPKKKTLVNTIVTSSSCKKVSMYDKLINVLKKNKKGLTHAQILEQLNVGNSGSVFANLKFMIKSKQVDKISCPHCDAATLYKLII
jgi:hypothetical protein